MRLRTRATRLGLRCSQSRIRTVLNKFPSPRAFVTVSMLAAKLTSAALFASIFLASGVAGQAPEDASSLEEATVAATCATAPYGKCGSNSDSVACCPDSYYCLPWDAAFFQCVPQPPQCTKQLTNVDLFGNDIKTIYAVQPSDCCTQCTQTPGCVAYTFVNSNPGQPACYLKSGVGAQTAKVGAVSGLVNGVTPPPSPPATTAPPVTALPPPTCATPSNGKCGDNTGTSCCPSDQYCQPWNPTFYQCIPKPARCAEQLTDTDFYGNDLATVYVSLPSLCCEACANTANCSAYTYVNYNPGQPACYLKSSAGTPTRSVGAVSAKLN